MTVQPCIPTPGTAGRPSPLPCSTQVGRKAAGEFAALLDKDWVRIGLRKP